MKTLSSSEDLIKILEEHHTLLVSMTQKCKDEDRQYYIDSAKEVLDQIQTIKLKQMANLKIGDKVMWSGGFGKDAPTKATVTGIEITNGGKYGDSVSEVEWNKVINRNVVVDLDNGHWAYASQIKPVQA